MAEILERLDDTFPLKFCPFRKIEHGGTFCEISTDPYVKEIDDLVCFNCPIPDLLETPYCRHLNIGTQIKAYKAGEKVVTSFACNAKRRRITLDSCIGCPLYELHREPSAEPIQEITVEVDDELLNEAVKRIEATGAPAEGHAQIFCPSKHTVGCPNHPPLFPKQVYVAGADGQLDEGFAAIFANVYEPVLRQELNLHPVQGKVYDFCVATDALLSSRFAVFDLSVPDPLIHTLMGIAFGLGKRVHLFAQEGRQLEKPWEDLGVVWYRDTKDLRAKLKEAFRAGVRVG